MNRVRAVSRREFGKCALALPGLGVLARVEGLSAASQLPKPSSVFGGVVIGINSPYSFGNEATDAASILRAHVQVGASAVELRSDVAELFAGAPASAGRGGGGGRGARGGGRGAQPPGPAADAQSGDAELSSWRTTVSMDKYQELRKTYEDAGVRILAFRFTLTAAMSDVEYDYAFRTAKTLGASQITMEMPGDAALTKRIGELASRHQLFVGYHMHTNATLTAWDQALSQSTFNAAQVDVGHYVAGTGESPIPLLQKHARQIASLHLKDRKTPAHGGANMSWGQGDTPLREILQFMKRERVTYPAFIELEHMNQLPPGSSRTLEVYRCVEYCRAALA
jgi:sugar phosphate isomerase/epimerase